MTSHSDDTREGKGRVRPGPSPSAERAASGARRRLPLSSRILQPAGALMVLFAAVGVSAFGTQAHQYSSPAALALFAAFGALVGVVLVSGLPRDPAKSVAEWLVPALAGAGGFAIAPWLVMANRYTDAPPGSEVAFFSVVSWGAMLSIALALGSHERVRRIGATLLALAAAASVLANWERPSSFSPLVRYPREELVMLLAGVLWVALVLVLLRASRRGTLGVAALRASLGGAIAAFALALPPVIAGSLTANDLTMPGLWAYGVATAFLTAGVLIVLRTRSAMPIVGAYLLVPSAMSLLLMLESVFGYRGPNPLLVGPILAATVITLAGIALATGTRETRAEEGSGSAPTGPGVRLIVARVVASIALAAAVVTLALPGTTAEVQATRADGTRFEANFDLYGFEVVGSWLALGVACAALGVVLQPSAGRNRMYHAGATLAAIAAWPFVADTPARTLTSFIPTEVQVDYGSEFARIDFAGGPSMLAIVALGGALLAVGVTLSRRETTPFNRPEDTPVMTER